jgi:hypothetical protein
MTKRTDLEKCGMSNYLMILECFDSDKEFDYTNQICRNRAPKCTDTKVGLTLQTVPINKVFSLTTASPYASCTTADSVDITSCKEISVGSLTAMCIDNTISVNAYEPTTLCQECGDGYYRVQNHGQCILAATCKASVVNGIQVMDTDEISKECKCIDKSLVMISTDNVFTCEVKSSQDEKCLLFNNASALCMVCDIGYKTDGSATCVKEDCTTLVGCDLCFDDSATLKCAKADNSHTFDPADQITMYACADSCTNCQYKSKIGVSSTSPSDNCEYHEVCNTDDQCMQNERSDLCQYLDNKNQC